VIGAMDLQRVTRDLLAVAGEHQHGYLEGHFERHGVDVDEVRQAVGRYLANNGHEHEDDDVAWTMFGLLVGDQLAGEQHQADRPEAYSLPSLQTAIHRDSQLAAGPAADPFHWLQAVGFEPSAALMAAALIAKEGGATTPMRAGLALLRGARLALRAALDDRGEGE
jgi:hypothetical protein